MPKVLLQPASSSSAGRPILVDALPSDLPEDIELGLFQNENPRKAKQISLRGENGRTKVEAVNYGPCPSISSAYQYALVCVQEDDSLVVVVNPCERVTTKRTVKALERAVDKNRKPNQQELDYIVAQNALGEAFGTKRRKQAIHNLEKNQIDMSRLQTSSASFINKAIDDTIVSRLPTPEPSETGSVGSCVDNRILPPYCITAEKPQDCYPLIGKLIPQDIWMGLPQFKNESEFVHSMNPGNYVKARIIVKQDDNNQFIAAYLNYLIKLFALKESAFNDAKTTLALLRGVDTSTQTRILEEFSEVVVTEAGKKRYKLPNVKKDRLALHICVLALHLDSNLQVCVNELAEELAISVSKAQQYYKTLGCVVETQGKKDGGKKTFVRHARLQAPLVLPKPALRR